MKFIENIEKGLSNSDIDNFLANISVEIGSVKKILIIHPDYTRIDFTDKIVPATISKLRNFGTVAVDFLNAGGTHRKMTEEEFLNKLGLKEKDNRIHFYNHQYDGPASLITIGNIDSDLVKEKTDGQLTDPIPITVNKLIFDNYDLIIAISGTVPHEASGYSGGLKIFFPGISGPEVIDLFHWAAVLVGLPRIIGTVDNNARDIINQGSYHIFKKIKTRVYSFNMVNTEKENDVLPVGLYVDQDFEGFKGTYQTASSTSSKVHVKYIDEPLEQVVQEIPQCYDEIWTAAKGSYKLQKPGVMAKGGEMILYAPHIKLFHSNKEMNGEMLKLGYHCKDNVCIYLESNTGVCRNVAAHMINLAGPGIFDRSTGKEELHFKVTLATGIPEAVCKSVGLGYRDPESIKKEDFNGPGRLWIKEGGKYLYDLKKNRKVKL